MLVLGNLAKNRLCCSARREHVCENVRKICSIKMRTNPQFHAKEIPSLCAKNDAINLINRNYLLSANSLHIRHSVLGLLSTNQIIGYRTSTRPDSHKISSNTKCKNYRHNRESISNCSLSTLKLGCFSTSHRGSSWHTSLTSRRLYTTAEGGGGAGTCNNSNGVPEYLVGSITEVDCPENYEDPLEETENELEDEIVEFLSCRSLQYDEADCSFVIACPTCSANKKENVARDIFVDKHSGYFVCPWCCSAGSWEELSVLLDSQQDTLSPAQLDSLLEAALPMSDPLAQQLISNSKYKMLTEETLAMYGCRVMAEGGRLVVPVRRSAVFIVGYYSVPLVESPNNKVVSRFLRGGSCVWSSLVHSSVNSSSTSSFSSCETSSVSSNAPSPPDISYAISRAVVVSHVCEALYLAQCGLTSLTLPVGVDWDSTVQRVLNDSDSTGVDGVWGTRKGITHIALWLTRTNTLPYRFFVHLNTRGIPCAAVSPPGDAPLYTLTKAQLGRSLKGCLLPLLSDKVVPFDTLEDKIYHRLTHQNEVHGVPFQRFTGLQSLLLGHRAGEVTVVSGPTGGGKTTLMAEYSLDLAMQGVITLWVSLEVSVVRLCEVLMQQYSGAPLPRQKHLFSALAHHFRQLPIYFLDVHGQQDLQHIIQVLRESVVMRGVQHVVVDNLQFLVGCQDTVSERWQQQDRAVAEFRSFATQQRCHISLIVHPKKLMADEALTMQSIGGGARVTQEADNVLLLQVMEGSTPAATRKAVQVAKNRYGGSLGIVPIKFHNESLTFSGWFRRNKGEKKSNRKTSGQPEPAKSSEHLTVGWISTEEHES